MLIGSFITGALQAILMPTQQSITPNLVEREELSNAIGLMSAGMSLSRVVGPTIAGTVIGFVSTGGSFLIQAIMVSTAFVMATLIRIPARAATPTGAKGLNRLSSGFAIVAGRADLRVLFAVGFIPRCCSCPSPSSCRCSRATSSRSDRADSAT